MINHKKSNVKLTERDYWKTDPNVVDQLISHYQIDGGIVDAAATVPIPQAYGFYSEQDNAFNVTWRLATHWLNPPFSLKSEFINLAIEQSQMLSIRVFGLLPCDPSTKFFKFLVDNCEEITLLNKRLAYIDQNNKLIKGASFNSLAYLINPFHRGKAKIKLLDIKQ